MPTSSPIHPQKQESGHVVSQVEAYRAHALPRLDRLWSYYRNRLTASQGEQGRSYLPQQVMGLPARLRRQRRDATAAAAQPELVIENDIAWRIHAIVDFMFARPVVIQSVCADREKAGRINALIQNTLAAAGGVGFFQDLALLGSVYGFVDVLVTVGRSDASQMPGEAAIKIDLIEPTRSAPMLDRDDYRKLAGYGICVDQPTGFSSSEGSALGQRWFGRLRHRLKGSATSACELSQVHVWTDEHHQVFEPASGPLRRSWRLTSESEHGLGTLPIVHFQNLAQPFAYEGLSEVEPLIPLQDELNIRLSDRANRVTFQSFKMYLGKCIEHFNDRPVGPGQMWSTDNPDATIEEFGGDGQSPSEDAHIAEIREAMDKTSGVSPVSAGVIRGKVGNLTSENALRIVMMGLLAKTDKKRVTYGAGIERLCAMILHVADHAGLLSTTPDERRVRIDWPNPLPESESQRLRDALLKKELGVPQKQLLTELGYGEYAQTGKESSQ